MSDIANTPKSPYYAVIFSSHRTDGDNGYAEMVYRMVELAAQRLGHQQWHSSFRVRIAKVERECGI